MSPFYNLSAKKPNGENLPMKVYKNKIVLIVNTATRCGLTPQLRELENLHQTYKEKGLVVLGFPCNQFAWQEPTPNHEIETVCHNLYQVSFQLTEKVNVNGKKTHPVFQFLKSSKSGLFTPRIGWNFTKFLVNREGVVIKRYSPRTTVNIIEKDILKLV